MEKKEDINITKTQGIKYTGSKKKILSRILEITKTLPDIKFILDGFSGTTRVSQMYKLNGYNVDSNDMAVYSKVFSDCYLMNNQNKEYYVEKINHLNNLNPIKGWFSENYGGVVSDNPRGNAIQLDGKNRPWQIHNTMKLDAIRDEIDIICDTEIEKSVLLTSLILAMDKVDNTIGHQVAYLKNWSKRSFNDIKLLVPDLILNTKGVYNSLNKNVFDIQSEYDLIYLDPPYGTNNKKMPTSRVRYFSYYHIWSTLVKNDKPEVIGAANRRKEFSSDRIKTSLSAFESTDLDVVKNSIRKLLELNTRYFLFSYNNKSKVSIPDLIDIFNEKNELIETLTFSYKENVMKNMRSTNIWSDNDNENKEFLFLIKKK